MFLQPLTTNIFIFAIFFIIMLKKENYFSLLQLANTAL